MKSERKGKGAKDMELSNALRNSTCGLELKVMTFQSGFSQQNKIHWISTSFILPVFVSISVSSNSFIFFYAKVKTNTYSKYTMKYSFLGECCWPRVSRKSGWWTFHCKLIFSISGRVVFFKVSSVWFHFSIIFFWKTND